MDDMKLLTRDEVADRLKVCKKSVANWEKREIDPLPVIRLSPRHRVYRADAVEAWVRRKETA